MNHSLSLVFRSASMLINSMDGLRAASKAWGAVEALEYPRATLGQARAKTRPGGRSGIMAALFVTLAIKGLAQGVPPLTFPTWIPVGTTSAATTVTITSRGAGAVSSVQVVTQGANGLDFEDAGGLCSGATFLAAGQTCTELVTFSPRSPGVHVGAVQLLGAGNTVLGTAYLSGVGTGGLGVLLSGQIVTVGGSGDWKVVRDGPALSAGLYLPTSIALDGAGSMYIADSLHNRIRKLDTTQTMWTIAGNGMFSYTGDGGPAVSATLNSPSGVAVDGAGNIFIADTGNNVIREIEAASGMIRTVAGDGNQGNRGDNGLAQSAELNQPLGITVDIGGNLYIADTGNSRIRRVDAHSGVITNFAGSPDGVPGYSGDNGPARAAHLNGPNAVAFDIAGNCYIPDSLNNVIREVYATGGIGTFAGGGSAPLQYGITLAAQLNGPSGVLVDAAQNVYIADTQNEAIRKVFAGSAYFTTVAEFGTTLGFFDGTNYEQALYGPAGLARDPEGNIYIADEFSNQIREIQSNRVILDFASTSTHVGATSATASLYLENDGNGPLTLTSITPDVNAGLDTTVENACVTGSSMGPLAGCIIGTQFKPATTGSPLIGNVNITADAGGNSPLRIELAGKAIPPSPTTLSVMALPNSSTFEQNVAFLASVFVIAPAGTSTTNLGVPDGTVTFFADGAVIGTATLDAAGQATLHYSALTVGTHVITASYAGSNDFMASDSAPFSERVQPIPTSTNLDVSSSGGGPIGSPALAATVIGTTSLTPIPTGTVTFVSAGATIGTVALNASGVATLNPQASAHGYTVVANYSGDAVHASSSSSSVEVKAVPPDFDIAVNPPTLTMATGQHATVRVIITAKSGYSDTIGLGCSSLPGKVTCHFSRNNLALAANSSEAVQLTIDTNNPLGGGLSAMNPTTGTRSISLAGIFLPAGLLLGGAFWRARKRNRAVLTAALGLLLSESLLVCGCSATFTQSSATPGTYVIGVTGVGASSRVAHYQNVTLAVTK